MWTYPSPFPEARPVGWTCPQCGQVMAPWMTSCPNNHSTSFISWGVKINDHTISTYDFKLSDWMM